MNTREWALITFTILAQMSVGSFLVLGVIHYFSARTAGTEEADRLSDRALVAIGPILALGLLASLWHLGTPLRAYRAIFQVGNSWLSREILFGVLFAATGALFALMQWRKISTFAVRNAVAWGAAIIGLGLVYTMSRIYMLPTVPVWNTLATPIAFFTTTFLLGALGIGAAMVANYGYLVRKDPGCAESQCRLVRGSLRWIAVISMVLLGIEFVLTPLFVSYLAALGGPAAASARMMVGSFSAVFALRLVLVFFGAGILSLFLYRNSAGPGRELIMARLAYAAFTLALVSEVLGRFLFYATYARVGI